MRKKALIIFTRVPVPGKTKTRLMPYFTPEQCAKLHCYFLKDIAATCKEGQAEADLYVCYCEPADDAGEESFFERTAGYQGGSGRLVKIFGECAGYFPQEGETLGQRMYRAIEKVLERGYESCLLMGTDVPEVQWGDIRLAYEVQD